MRFLLYVFVPILLIVNGFSQEQQLAYTAPEKAIADQLRGLRAVPDAERGKVTRQMAIDIRALPAGSPRRLVLASGLANLSTEGDYGRATLEEVAKTLAGALVEKPQPLDPQGSPAPPYLTLAQLARYEGITVNLADPAYARAMKQLEALDQKRAQADFTLTDLNGKRWSYPFKGGGDLSGVQPGGVRQLAGSVHGQSCGQGVVGDSDHAVGAGPALQQRVETIRHRSAAGEGIG